MIVRNEMTGALHEVPDQQLYEVGETVDGLGYLTNIARGVRNLVSAPIRAAAAFVPGAAPLAMMAQQQPGLAPFPPLPGLMPPGLRPPGWIPPQIPYTGRQPRRVYLRCSTWPGPPGLVPASAAAGFPVPGTPGFPGAVPPGTPGIPPVPGMPGAPGMPAMPGPFGGGRRRRRRR
jgi:hypothetical protein